MAKVLAKFTTGVGSGFAAVSLTDQDLGMKLLQSLFGGLVLAIIQFGVLMDEYAKRKKPK